MRTMTQQELLKQLVEIRIKRVLLRLHQHYEKEMYNQVGRGVTPQEYVSVIDKLVSDGGVTRSIGARCASIVTLIESQHSDRAMMEQTIFNIDEVASLLRVSKRSVYEWTSGRGRERM